MKISQSFLFFNQKIAQLAPLWTQGAGSNLSEKTTAEKMLIKASGFRLDHVTTESGYVELDSHKLRDLLLLAASKPKSDQETLYSESLMKAKTSPQGSLRPSMEAGFHALSIYKYVLHFHSLAAILMGHHPEWLKEKQMNLIPLVNPGWELSQFFFKNEAEFNILLNHGVILQSNSEEILEKWNKIENSFLTQFNYSLLLSLKNQLTSKIVSRAKPPPLTRSDFTIFQTGPLKFYFPDMAIYFQKLKPYLASNPDGNYTLLPEANDDLFEIWISTQILYQSNPQLPELPESMIESITKLPTEQLRQNFIKG